MEKKAVMFFGKPTSGKGTQASLVANKIAAVNFDTGRHIDTVVHDPANANDPIIQAQRAIYDSGKLNDPPWVLAIVQEKVKEVHESELGIVFSGSPRTLFEAEGLVPLLVQLYGKEHVHAFLLEVSDDIALKRSASRLICSFCGQQFLESFTAFNPTTCPLCAGELKKRILDTPEKMKIRFKEYEERTAPVLDYLNTHGVALVRINGEELPYEVFNEIYVHLTQK